MKILIVCKSFYPEISPRSFRATELAKEFARQGHAVSVCFPTRGIDYSDFSRQFGMEIVNLGELKWKEISSKGSRIEKLIRRILRRFLGLFFEYPDMELIFKVRNKLAEFDHHDLLVSIAVPHPVHWGVSFVPNRDKKIYTKWMADCGDPYMFGRLDSFKKPFYFRYFEKKFCRQCDFISVPFENMKVQFYREFLSKIVVIPQGYNLENRIIKKEYVKNIVPTFIFAGSIIPGIRDLDLFFDYLMDYPGNFSFIVYTSQPFYFEQFKNKLNGKLAINSYINREELITRMSGADFLVNVDTTFDSKQNVEAVPSKLIDYAIAGRPILNIKSGLGDDDLYKAFLNGDYREARKIDLEKYNIKEVVKKFISLV